MPADSSSRPLWSVMIPVYNSTQYLAQTLESVLSQDPGPARMQIEVVDGCSTACDPAEVVNRVGKGRVELFRHAQPLRMYQNWNSCIERARGEWVHLLHSDDFVLPGFYDQLEKGVAGRDEVGAAFCRWKSVDAEGQTLSTSALEQSSAGILANWHEKIASGQRIQFASVVVRKTAYQSAGGFSPDLVFALDWEMWVRLAALFPFWYEPETLACYRVHAGSESSRLRRQHEDSIDHGKAVIYIGTRLPSGSTAREALAHVSLVSARDLLIWRQPRAAFRQLCSTLKLSHSPAVLASSLGVLGFAAAGGVRVALKKIGLR